MKKVILIFVLIAPLIGLGLYFFLERSPVPPTTPTAKVDTPATPPPATASDAAPKEADVATTPEQEPVECLPKAVIDLLGPGLTVEEYQRDEFYEGLNGGADHFLKRGALCYYRATTPDYLTLEVFRFNNTTAGEVLVYEANAAGAKPIKVCETAMAGTYGISCGVGNYWIQLYHNELMTPERQEKYVELLNKIIPLLPPPDGDNDVVTKLFPPKGLESVLTIMGPWLGQTELGNTRVAIYKLDGGGEARGFIHRFLTTEDAVKFFKQWPGLLKWDMKTTKALKSKYPKLIIGAGLDPESGRGWTVLFQFGRFLGGMVLGDSDALVIGTTWAEAVVDRIGTYIEQ